MSLSTQPYKGSRDFYPEDKRVLNSIFKTWRHVAEAYGYEEVDAPILEPVELYTTKTSDEIVTEQSYAFTDRGGREVMLRPEMTPSVSRMLAGRRQELTMPVRWFSIPWCWRYERPQKGRNREFYQLNVDLFGVEGFAAEVEMLQIVDSMLQAFKAKPDMYEIKISSRVLIDYILATYIGLDEVEQKTVIRLIDRMHKIQGPEFAAMIEASISPTLREQGAAEKLLALLKLPDMAQLPTEIKQHESYQNLQKLMEACASLGMFNITFDITLVRGFDYYTDFVFEVNDTDPENSRSMFGGGRYDGLVGMFGVAPVPTVGFAASDVMLMEFLKGHHLLPKLKPETEVYAIIIGDVYEEAVKVVAELRRMGVSIATDITGRKIDRQLSSAAKKAVPYVMFIGEQELDREQYKIKNMETGVEETHSLQRIVSIVKDRRKPAQL